MTWPSKRTLIGKMEGMTSRGKQEMRRHPPERHHLSWVFENFLFESCNVLISSFRSYYLSSVIFPLSLVPICFSTRPISPLRNLVPFLFIRPFYHLSITSLCFCVFHHLIARQSMFHPRISILFSIRFLASDHPCYPYISLSRPLSARALYRSIV